MYKSSGLSPISLQDRISAIYGEGVTGVLWV